MTAAFAHMNNPWGNEHVPVEAMKFYGYDCARPWFRSKGKPIFGFDSCASWPTDLDLECSPAGATKFPRFTGKERDAESGLDYFGARYYESALGRFTSPDWSAAPEPVPYAELNNPQTLNQYSYVGNNPLTRADADRHCGLIDNVPCSFSQWTSSLPDRLVGGLKFEANTVLEMVHIGAQFTPSNSEQADAMKVGESVKPEFETALAMAVPGPKGAKGEEVEVLSERFRGRYADGEKAFRTNVPRGENGEPEPLPDASGPHSRLQPDAKNPERTYSATEFDANGKPVRRIDFAGRKGDTVPHQHDYDLAKKTFEKDKKPVQ